MSERRVDAFFYGLFMNKDILSESNVFPRDARRGYVDDFALCIGQQVAREARAPEGKLPSLTRY